MRFLAVLALCLGPAYAALGQQATEKGEFHVESWQKGSARIGEHHFDILLNSAHPEFAEILSSEANQRQYKLLIRHNPITNEPVEHWKVELYEISKTTGSASKNSGDDLLTQSPRDPERDYFPRGDLIGYLYPNPTKQRLGAIGLFPIAAKRVIRVEGFVETIQVTSYELNKQDPQKFDTLHLTIDVSNLK